MRYDKEKMCYVKSASLRSEFREKRLLALKRDGYKCVKCGATENLHVHHIIALSKDGTNDLGNLVTLCPSCHAEEHKNDKEYRIMIKAHYFTKKQNTIQNG
jgi:5-methylcytosine-specific restriction endonuclease McrA